VTGPIRELAVLLVCVALAACEAAVDPSSPTPAAPSGAPSTTVPTSAPSAPSAAPSAAVSLVPSASPATNPDQESLATVAHDPRKFGFAVKGMSHEVMAFVTSRQVDYALSEMDFDVISTVAFFSLNADQRGRLAQDSGWRTWTSPASSRKRTATFAVRSDRG